MKKLLLLIFTLIVLLANSSCTPDTLKTNNHTGKVSINELYEIKPLLKDKQKKFKYSGNVNWKSEYSLKCFIGLWCHDTKREIPRLFKILKDAGVKDEQIEIFLLSKNKKEPENEVKKNKIFYTPTIIILKNGVEVERFVEHPYSNWVDDLNRVLEKN